MKTRLAIIACSLLAVVTWTMLLRAPSSGNTPSESRLAEEPRDRASPRAPSARSVRPQARPISLPRR
jgi:hypothetical protein